MPAHTEQLVSLVYSSTATEPFSDADLAALLTVSRRNNALAGISGLLLYRDGRFLQTLEGPEGAVAAQMIRISDDNGHRDIRVLLKEPVQRRQFADWTMGFHTEAGSGRDAIPGYRSAFDDLEDPGSIEGNNTADAVRVLMGWFREHPNHIA